MAGEVFISYRRADQAKARLLHALLKQRGVDAWYDALLSAGDDWRHKTAEALNAAPIFVLLFSKVASESDDISKELAAATFSKKLVIPVRIDDIKPVGAFLYELASRNWFDAFEDTEARFEVLADQLAALVKGGPAAEVAAFSFGSPQPAPSVRPAAKPLFGQPLVLGGIALAAVALIAVLGFTAMRPHAASAGAPATERIAFFGFTAQPDDPIAKEIARTATDETFTTLDAMSLETIARSVTEGAPLSRQVEQAKSLGARYALGGEVRKQGETYTMSIRLDDAPLGAALSQKALPSGTAAQKLSLPIQAAVEATRTAQCFVDARRKLQSETEHILALLRRFCTTPDRTIESIGALREIAQESPRTAYIQAMFAGYQLAILPQFPPAERAARIDEARRALALALKLDPGEPWIVQAQAFLGIIEGRPLQEIDALFRAALDRDPNAFIILVAYRDFLTSVGKQRDALAYAERARQRSPLNATAKWTTALLLLHTGRVGEGDALFEETNVRFPSPGNWQLWVSSIAPWPSADMEHALASRPAGVSDQTFSCLRDIALAAASRVPEIRRKGAARWRACVAAKAIPDAGYISAAFGDVDHTYELVQAVDRTTPLAFLNSTNPLFDQSSRPIRDDKRFKQLTIDHGLWQYWIDTRTMPDICSADERDSAFCTELRAAQATK